MQRIIDPIVLDSLTLDSHNLDSIKFSTLSRMQLLNVQKVHSLPNGLFVNQYLAVCLKMEILYLMNFRRPFSQNCLKRFVHTYFYNIDHRIRLMFVFLDVDLDTQYTNTVGKELLL
nr:hypothetical protein [Proteomonas sp. NEIS-1375]